MQRSLSCGLYSKKSQSLSCGLYSKKPRLSSSSDDDLDERRRLFLERNRSVCLLTYNLMDKSESGVHVNVMLEFPV